MVSGDFGEYKKCGWSPFSGKKIMINTNPICMPNYESNVKHELKHTFFWNLPKQIQISYCKNIGMSYGKLCWEDFAER